MKLDKHYTDPRLVDMYDLENPLGADHDFFQKLIRELDARIIIDLGCGTGIHTREFVGNGRKVYGVDPAPAMLAYARCQPGADSVIWVEGDSSALGDWSADFALMTGNVAQVFLKESAWQKTVGDLYQALKPGGTLAFESRNPLARSWAQWTPKNTRQTMETPHGSVESWLEVIDANKKIVHFRGYNHFLATNEMVLVDSRLRFRTKQEIRQSLEVAGFEVVMIYGRWNRTPFLDESPLIIFVAKK